MISQEDVQSFIERLSDGVAGSEEVEPGMWLLTPTSDGVGLVVSFDPPVLVFRVNVMELPPPGSRRTELMRKLLELNAGELVHGSYGIEGGHVVLTDALQLEDLDFSEFQATYDSITLALASHMPALASYQE